METSDLLRRHCPAFADLRDKLGMHTVHSRTKDGRWTIRIENSAISLSIARDIVDTWFDIRPISRKSDYPLHLLLRELNLWDDRDHAQDSRKLASVLEENLQAITTALQDDAFWIGRLGRS